MPTGIPERTSRIFGRVIMNIQRIFIIGTAVLLYTGTASADLIDINSGNYDGPARTTVEHGASSEQFLDRLPEIAGTRQADVEHNHENRSTDIENHGHDVKEAAKAVRDGELSRDEMIEIAKRRAMEVRNERAGENGRVHHHRGNDESQEPPVEESDSEENNTDDTGTQEPISGWPTAVIAQ